MSLSERLRYQGIADWVLEEIHKIESENARLREALKTIADGGAGIGELATPVERMILMSEIAQDVLEKK